MVVKNAGSTKSKAEATDAGATPEITKGLMAHLRAPAIVIWGFLSVATIGIGTGYQSTKYVFCKTSPEEAICVRSRLRGADITAARR